LVILKLIYEQTLNALEHGASHFTHLGNATGMPHQRKPGLVSAALLDENASIEIICDGHHLHSAIVKIFLKVKGFDKVTFSFGWYLCYGDAIRRI
jgi:N-acetylglucosamine-6-phosphate deacetylase